MADKSIEIDSKLVDFLIQERFITEAEMQKIREEAEKDKKSLQETLFANGILRDADLGKIVADLHGWNFVNLRKQMIPEKVLKKIPESLAKQERVLAFEETDKGTKVAMASPDTPLLLNTLEQTLGNPVIPYYATAEDLIENLYRYEEKIETEFDRLVEAHTHEATFGSARESAIVQLVDLLMAHAYKKRASDIHIDPQSADTIVRFRLDGILHDIVRIPAALHERVINRIKVMSHLRTDEHQTPQDGKIAFKVDGILVDVRVSVVPTTKGENVVMRLLASKGRELTLETLGLSEKDFRTLEAAIKKPWGMILVTGPTGSGKTTTLYAVLKILNTKEVNIATIEDPVEYAMDGVTQIQVNPKAGLTFASGLRSIVRQDPNIIMVGEIRDHETADIAVNSAMTGHLVLSTLHTNDAATSLPRLLDMGIERFLLASTVNVVMAQRLARRICTACIASEEISVDALKRILPTDILERMIHGKEKLLLYRGRGCPLCKQTGYLGRVGAFELLEMTDEIRSLIMKNADADTIRKMAREQGMTTMWEDAIEKVLNGLITLEEMMRVVKA